MHADTQFFDYAYAPWSYGDYQHDYSTHGDYQHSWDYNALGPASAMAPHSDYEGHWYGGYQYARDYADYSDAPAPNRLFTLDYSHYDYYHHYELPTLSEDTEVLFFDTPFTLPPDLYVKAGDINGTEGEGPAHVPHIVVEGDTWHTGYYYY